MRVHKALTIAAAMAVLGTTGVVGGAGPALAEWPERPVTLIVPWSAGGGTDATARILAQLLEDEFDTPFAVVNRTGGGGVVGHVGIAQAKPDDYTFGVITTELSMYRWRGLADVSYEDVVPVAQYNSDAPGLLVRADSPYETAADLLEAIKSGKAMKASGANQGGLLHLAMVGMLESAGIDPTSVTWVPTQGGAQGLAELTSNGVDFVTNNVADAKSLIEAGEVRALATMAEERNAAYPDVPTLKEATGLDWTIANWRGIAAPKGVSDDVVQRLSEAVLQVCHGEEFADFMTKRGYTVACLGPDEFREQLARKQEQFGAALKAADLAE
ncbi:tripartite tricarboxylate transporter substrate binding protein [Microbaculum marinum]|uniref:Tripartite tricarboxylate transporter substrate binding protein n=1 Tax=Microbaculum marinum TaxID=1764581 RepID=A0AAW9RIB7_9HYPH